jgi:sporulation protein YunB
MRDIINKYALNELEYLVTKIIDESVYNCFEKYKYDYNSLMIITKDDNGTIKSIGIDPYTANIIKSDISQNIIERVNKISNDDLEITLGMLLGNFTFGSWGPKLPFTVSPNGNVSIDFSNKIVSSGINQVHDSLTVDVDVEISAMVPFYNINSTIHSSVIISQMIIIGDVPDTYLDIGDKTNDR